MRYPCDRYEYAATKKYSLRVNSKVYGLHI